MNFSLPLISVQDFSIAANFNNNSCLESLVSHHNYNSLKYNKKLCMDIKNAAVTTTNSKNRAQTSFSSFSTTKLTASERSYQCDICKKSFTQQSNLYKHSLIHYGVKPFNCDRCTKTFTQQANLTKHLRIHTGEKPYCCSICDKQFSQNANLKKHMQLHTGEKHYTCDFCDKQFVQRANLYRHRRIHTGEKPFSCSICQKSFTQKGNLAKHKATHIDKFNSERRCIENALSQTQITSHQNRIHAGTCVDENSFSH